MPRSGQRLSPVSYSYRSGACRTGTPEALLRVRWPLCTWCFFLVNLVAARHRSGRSGSRFVPRLVRIVSRTAEPGKRTLSSCRRS